MKNDIGDENHLIAIVSPFNTIHELRRIYLSLFNKTTFTSHLCVD